jgi:hypothetical protein
MLKPNADPHMTLQSVTTPHSQKAHPKLEIHRPQSHITRMPRTLLASVVLSSLAITCLAGCALGPVSPRQRAEAQSDVPQDHPHPPARLANAPLDPSFNKLYCYNDGPNTICSRQAP